MPRRSHKKSRSGCLECKKRHIKCDEKRLVCTNCTVSERSCGYAITFSQFERPSRSKSPLATPSSTSAPIQSPSHFSAGSPTVAVQDDQPVNMLHAELLYNLFSDTWNTFDESRSTSWFSDIIPHVIRAPYVINEMLAFSALHLSTKRQDQREFYRYHAAQLQTHALSSFNDSSNEITQQTCVPLFVFSGFIGIHMLCDTLIYRENDFAQFLDRFVHYLRLHRGVRAISGESWSMLRQSVLKPVLDVGAGLYSWDGYLEPGCNKLLQLIKAAKLGASLTSTYQQAIESLQSANTASNSTDTVCGSINGVTTWPVLVNLEFSELLQQRRPEALIVLAHYAVLLHRCRHSWMFGDAGRFLIDSVSQYLGHEWEEWLSWPKQALHETLDT